MHPLSLAERGLGAPTISLREHLSGARLSLGGTTSVQLADYAEEIVASGFPAIPRQLTPWLRAYTAVTARGPSGQEVELIGCAPDHRIVAIDEAQCT